MRTSAAGLFGFGLQLVLMNSLGLAASDIGSHSDTIASLVATKAYSTLSGESDPKLEQNRPQKKTGFNSDPAKHCLSQTAQLHKSILEKF
jgi:hypothetical protein